MPPKPRPTPRGDYVETETGNKVSRKAQLHGTQHIFLSGRAVIQPGVCIRGDLRSPAPLPPFPLPSASTTTTIDAALPPPTTTTTTTTTTTNNDAAGATTPSAAYSTSVSIGRYTFLATNSVLRPPHRLQRGRIVYAPLRIGDHVFVGAGSVIEAASVGDHVWVGAGCVLGRMAIVKDWVRVLEGAVVPAGMVVASGSVVGGRPARVVGEVGEGWGMWEGMEGGDMRGLWRGVGA